MASSKEKLLSIMKILRETDEQHPITAQKIVAALARSGIDAERKSVCRDIELLRDNGWQIELSADNKAGFYLADREFEDWEIRVLADAAISAQFLTAKDTSILLQKLRRQVGKTAGKLIGQGVDATQISNKTDDNTVKLNIDLCMRAISINRKIRFQYADTLLTKDVVYRHAGRSSIISPYTLVWSEKRYFLIGCKAGYEGVSVYRLDRMIKPDLLDSKRKPLPEALGCLPGQDPDLMLQQYLQQMFNMYGGEKIELHLICRRSAADDILQQFGSVSSVKQVGDAFHVIIHVLKSEGLYQWLLQHCIECEVAEPTEIREEVRQRLLQALLVYSSPAKS